MSSTALTQFRYGSHWHPAGEVNLVNVEHIPLISENREQWGTIRRLHLVGEIIASGAQAINTAIKDLEEAYAENDQFAGLYRSDGSTIPQNANNQASLLTQHHLDPGDQDNISGVQVERVAFPRGGPDELATVRTFHIILSSTYLDADSLLIGYTETTRIIGINARRFQWVFPWRRVPGSNIIEIAPARQVITPGTPVTVIQSGRATGLTFYPLGNVPPPLFPSIEQSWLRELTLRSPRWQGNAYTHYGAEWRYVMHSKDPVNPSAF